MPFPDFIFVLVSCVLGLPGAALGMRLVHLGCVFCGLQLEQVTGIGWLSLERALDGHWDCTKGGYELYEKVGKFCLSLADSQTDVYP